MKSTIKSHSNKLTFSETEISNVLHDIGVPINKANIDKLHNEVKKVFSFDYCIHEKYAWYCAKYMYKNVKIPRFIDQKSPKDRIEWLKTRVNECENYSL